MKSASVVDLETKIEQLRAGDPLSLLLRVLQERLGLRRWQLVLGVTILLNFPVVILCIVNGAWFSSQARLGLSRDYNWWILQVIAIPSGAWFFFWLPDGISGVVEGLKKNRVIAPKAGGDSVEQFMAKVTNTYSRWWWAAGSGGLVLCFMIFFAVPEQASFKTWETAGSAVFFYTISFWAVIFWIAALSIIRLLLAIVWFNKLFTQFKVTVRVLHPDRAGGLSPLGRFSVRVSYLIGVLGLAVVSTSLFQVYLIGDHAGGPITTPLAILIAVYLIAAPLTFFAPMGAARDSMKAAKDEFLELVADQFESETAKLRSLLSSDSDQLSAVLEKIEQLKAIHALASRFPVWPFNTATLVRFVSAILWPLLLATMPLFIGS